MRRLLAVFLFVASLCCSGALFAQPGIGIVIDSRGSVFFTDLKQVWKIAPDGTLSVAVPHVSTHELYIDADDNLFGEHLWYEGEETDTWAHRVWRRSRSGEIVDVIPPTEGLRTDYSFVRDARGNMYWVGPDESDSDNRLTIEKKTPWGERVTLAGGVRGKVDAFGAAARFRHLGRLYATPDGVIYAIDNGALRRITSDGHVRTVVDSIVERRWWSTIIGKSNRIMGLCADEAGNVYVALASDRIVKKITRSGDMSVVAQTTSPYIPTGVAIASNGDLYVLEYADTKVRVKKVSKSGGETYYRVPAEGTNW